MCLRCTASCRASGDFGLFRDGCPSCGFGFDWVELLCVTPRKMDGSPGWAEIGEFGASLISHNLLPLFLGWAIRVGVGKDEADTADQYLGWSARMVLLPGTGSAAG